MPRGDSQYLPLAQELVKQYAARGAFVYIMEGALGDSWALWAPPEVAARLPEILDDVADTIEAGAAEGQTEAALSVVVPTDVVYQDMAVWIARRAEARCVFIYVVEGRNGSGWAASGAPDVRPMVLAELVRGFAGDLRDEERSLRRDAGIDDAKQHRRTTT